MISHAAITHGTTATRMADSVIRARMDHFTGWRQPASRDAKRSPMHCAAPGVLCPTRPDNDM
ncbi:hypothetical protein [Nonomuraea sp. NPDC049709]|uniref:hypothetical protein n=1 Tax=Nonomuraea sp. NPDC049709 TaxID=3154736 RepID=UPI003439B098